MTKFSSSKNDVFNGFCEVVWGLIAFSGQRSAFRKTCYLRLKADHW